jgi:serine phosphatase RsbU (regulator of sigma subunit)
LEESFLQVIQASESQRADFNKFCPVAAWDVIFRNKERNERFRLLVSPAGDVFHFQHVLPSKIPGANLEQNEALMKFQKFLKELWDIDWDQYELIDAQSVSQESRTDHFFKWERKEKGIGGVQYRIWGVVAGDQVSSWDRHYQVPQGFTEVYNQKTEKADFFEFGQIIFIIIIFVFALISFVMRFQAGEVSTSNSFVFASFSLIVIALYFTNFFTSQPVLRSAFTEDNRTTYLTALYINLAIFTFFSTLFLFFVWGSGESLTREYWNKKLKVVDALFAKKPFFPEIGFGIIRGFSLTFIQLGLWYFALNLISSNSKVWILLTSEDNQALSTFFPASVPVIGALFLTILAISYAPLFTLSFLKKNFKSTVVAVFLTIIIFQTFFNYTFSIYSKWIQVILSLLIGSIFYLYYIRYDLFTVAVGAFISYCLTYSMMFLVQPDNGFQLAGIGGLVTIGLILMYGIAAIKRGKEIDEEEIKPRYTRNITERERLKMELEIARKAQLGMLPREIPKFPMLDIAAFMEPAKEVGGDYYDFIQIASDKLGIVIGDVSGKGMPAALYMTLMKGFLQSQTEEQISPEKILSRINRSFYKTAERNIFVSVFYCIIDLSKSEMTYARAGHNPTIMLHSANHQTSLLQTEGMAIGLDKGEVFDRSLKEETISFNIGDVFLFYTDGLTEGRNKALEEFGEERLMELVNQYKNDSAQEILHKIRKSYNKFVGKKEPDDDLTCLVVKIV